MTQLHLVFVFLVGLGLMNQVVERLLADRGVDHVLDHAVRLRLGRFGELVQQRGLADHLLGVCISAASTFSSARTPTRCAMWISSSTKVSVISRCRCQHRAASSV